MIIHGKKIEIIAEEENVSLPVDASLVYYLRKDWELIEFKKIIRSPSLVSLFKNLLKSYMKENKRLFLDTLKGLINEKIFLIIKQHPELVVQVSLTIHLKYYTNEKNSILASFISDLAGPEDLFLSINVSQTLLESLLKRGEEKLDEIIYHEFLHYFDNEYILKEELINKRINILTIRENTFFNNNATYIFLFFSNVRIEGIARVGGGVASNGIITYDYEEIGHAKKLLELLCEEFRQRISKKIYKELYGYRHRIGEMMVCTILIYELFRQGKQECAEVITESLFSTTYFYIRKIKKFYNSKDFSVSFQDEVKIVFEELKYKLVSLSHLQFLKEYEKSCIFLGVTPYFTLGTYDEYKKLCWKNYQKLKYHYGFLT